MRIASRHLPIAALAIGLALVPATAGAATISPTPGYLDDNFADDSNCSLREAIQVANTDSAAVENACQVNGILGADTIQLGAGTYKLQLTPDASGDDNADGDLDLVDLGGGPDPVAIIGQGAGVTKIDASPVAPDVRVIQVASPHATTLQDLAITGGNPAPGDALGFGGGVLVGPNLGLTLRRVELSDNHAINGGGVFSFGGVAVIDSSLTGNVASEAGGGILSGSAGPLTVSGSTTLEDNHANGGSPTGGGGAISTSGPLTISGPVVVSHNEADYVGGGIHVVTAPTTIAGAEISDNDSLAGGGIYFSGSPAAAIGITNSLIHANTATGHDAVQGIGGGVVVAGAAATIDGSRISSNSVSDSDNDAVIDVHSGGGVFAAGGSVTITDSTLSSNALASVDSDDDQLNGGAVATSNADLTVARSTISANQLLGAALRSGAGVSIRGGGTGRFENATVSGSGGASFGGGLETSSSQIVVVHTTIAANSASVGSGIDNSDAAILVGSIINQGPSGCAGPGTYTANAYNVDAGTSCVGAANDTDLESTNPMLGGLTDNGGPTQTRELLPGSPAIDATPNPSGCYGLDDNDLTVDQRGYPRPFPPGGACDAGAYEVFSCDGVVQRPPGPFVGCPVPPPPDGTPGGSPAPPTQPGSSLKKCKKKRKKPHGAAAAKKKKKKCKKRRKR